MNSVRQKQWNAFVKKKKAIVFVEAEDVIGLIKEFMYPIVDAIENDKEYVMWWNVSEKRWQEK